MTGSMTEQCSLGQTSQGMYNPALVHAMSGVEMTSFSPARHHNSAETFGSHSQSPMRDAWTHASQAALHLDSGLKNPLFQTTPGMGHGSDSMYANPASSMHHPSLEPSVFQGFNNVTSMYPPAQVVIPSQVNPQEDYTMDQYPDYDANDHVVEEFSRSFDSSTTSYGGWDTVGPQSPDAAYFAPSDDDEYVLVKDELNRSPRSRQHYMNNSPHRVNRRASRRSKKAHPIPHMSAERDCHGIIVRYEGKEWDNVNGRIVARHPDESKPHRCLVFEEDGTQCTAKFTRSEHLKRHMTKHSDEKPFPCPLDSCNKEIKRSDNAGDHFRTHLRPAAKGKRNKPCTLTQLANAMHGDSNWDDKKTTKMLTNLGKWLANFTVQQEEVNRNKALEEEAKARAECMQQSRRMHYKL